MLLVSRYSHHIVVTQYNPQEEARLREFMGLYTQKTFHKNEEPKVFAASPPGEYRFHINQMPHLLHHLKNVGVTYRITNPPLYEPEAIDVAVRPQWVLRDYQKPVVEYLTATDSNTKLVSAATGTGKTFMALNALSRIGKKVVIVILPTYIEKWAGDITSILELDKKDVMVVQGSAQLKGLIELAKNGTHKSPFTIISSRTLQNFIMSYESQPKRVTLDEYGALPHELFPLLKAGVLLIDETHQHIHALFKMTLYTHVPKFIGLTATLLSDDYTVTKIHRIMYPPAIRMPEQGLEKYTDVYAIAYNTRSKVKLRTEEWGSTNYSHNAYERSILKYPFVLENYLKILDNVIEIGYLQKYEKGDKLAIYASTVAMCDAIVEHLERTYPQFDIRRYCEDDPYENVIEPDIRVSTIISSGTAIDIPNLRVVILTISLSSSPANIQVLGRLRKLEGKDTRFYYLYNESIPKHVLYHQKKIELFKPRVRSHVTLKSPYAL